MAIEPLTGSVISRNFGGIFSQRLDTDFFRELYDNATLKNMGQVIRVNAGLAVSDIDFALGTAVPGSPFMQELNLPANTLGASGPYRMGLRITEDVGVTSTELAYRINRGPFQRVSLQPAEGLPLLRFEVLAQSGDPLLYVVMRGSQTLSVIDTGPRQEVARREGTHP